MFLFIDRYTKSRLNCKPKLYCISFSDKKSNLAGFEFGFTAGSSCHVLIVSQKKKNLHKIKEIREHDLVRCDIYVYLWDKKRGGLNCFW